MNRKQLRTEVKKLITKDVDVLARMITKTMILYDLDNIEGRWKMLIKKNGAFESALHEELAQLARK